MALLTKTQMLARLDIWLDDADNFAFTPAQKAEGYNTVLNNDPLVYKIVVDTTLSTIANTSTYVPATAYDAILQVQIDANGDAFPLPMDRSGWEYINGQLIFNYRYRSLIAGKTMYLTAKQKLDADIDSVPVNLQAYVLHRATANMLTILSSRKIGRFLRNGTTLSELLQNQAYHEAQAMMLAKKLSNRHDIIV